MSRIVSKPGPPRTSCFTCRRRRKKCDMSKPYCERCLKGGHECLGYEDVRLRWGTRRRDPRDPVPSRLKPLSSAAPVETTRIETLDSVTLPSTENRPTLMTADTGRDSRPSILGVALLYNMNKPVSSANGGCVTTEPEFSGFDCSWPQDKTTLSACSSALTRRSFSDTKITSNYTSRTIEGLCQSIPPSVDATQMIKENHLLRVVNEYGVRRVDCWFSPLPITRNSVLTRVAVSKKMTWLLPLGATLFFWTLGQSNQTQDPRVHGYIGWVNKLEQKIASDSRNIIQQNDMADHLMIELEIVFFKFALADSVSGYISLQKTLPRFLQLVAVDSGLYMERPNGNLAVSFLRALTSPKYELRRFVIYDTVAALVLGVPPLVDYGYDEEFDCGFDWIRGIPVALAEVISQVNSWRAGSGRALDNWETLEMRVLAWKAPSGMRDEISAVENARAAVLESWKHVALIYIYMGMCGVSSHDSGVQAAVYRIVELGEAMSNSPIGVHMLTQYIVAGLAARLEKHRIVLYEKLLSLRDTRVWLFHGPQFGQVLYGLWHGTGVGGAPIMWEDYVRSRWAIIPI
ncbi:unnamed protein product [Rhizoctonia solani]|uniref:Zn(2)-C6 fungal-type domain-containing protein n=1 Tax=Rhizoctonia solani TaxID=456999 RepID=A0A8H2WRJ3_9AGAM|nr:unnamed protein product [Rhizoctonia solani]